MDKLRMPILALVALLIGIGIGINLPNQNSSKATSIPSPSPSLDFSYYENLLKQDQEIAIKKPVDVDLTGDNRPEIIYITSREGCASCHDQTLRIFDNQKEIFNETFDDVLFVPGNNSFIIIQPIRKEGEGYCCPSSFSMKTYAWDGAKEEFREPVIKF